jgi:hypothetical protein
MDMGNFFVRYGLGKLFKKKKFGTITQESRKIRTNCKNYNF